MFSNTWLRWVYKQKDEWYGMTDIGICSLHFLKGYSTHGGAVEQGDVPQRGRVLMLYSRLFLLSLNPNHFGMPRLLLQDGNCWSTNTFLTPIWHPRTQ